MSKDEKIENDNSELDDCEINGLTGSFQIYDTIITTKKGLVTGIENTDPTDPTNPPAPPRPTKNVVLTRSKLALIFTSASDFDLNIFYIYFNAFARAAKILDETHENFFLAQVLSEIGENLKSVRENLNYSEEALLVTFSAFTPETAHLYGRNEEHPADQRMIGNIAYGDRLGNNGSDTDDGYNFRGGGFFQLTGRGNYQESVDTFANISNLTITAEEFAEKITTVRYGLFGALAFWFNNDMDQTETIDDCTAIINLYTDTYDERRDNYYMIAAL